MCVWGVNIQIEDNIMDFDDLKIRTIREAYHTLPTNFQQILPWYKTEKCLRRGGHVDFASAVREFVDDDTVTTTDEINIEYVASVSECMCKLDLIQITAIHVLANMRVA